jgi:hypothetical protein
LPLWTALIALLVLAVVGLIGLGAILYFARSDKAKLQRQVQALETEKARARLNEEKASEDAKMALARTRQEELLAQARQATNVLERLSQQLDLLMTESSTLRTSEAGRKVALHTDLVAQSRRLYENVLPGLAPKTEVTTRLEGARRIEQQLLSSMGTTFQPQAEQMVTLQNSAVWADQELRKVSDAQNLVSGLVKESAVKTASAKLTPSSPTLDAAVNQLVQAESAWRQRAILDQTADAKTNEAAIVAQAEAQRIIEEARLKASNILAQVNEAKAKQEGEEQIRLAERKVQEATKRVQVQTKLDDAQRIELRKKASEPDIQAKLAPFISPGYWKIKGIGPDMKPLSLNGLRSFGALEPTMVGLDRLVNVACSPRDRVRPRWKLQGGTEHWRKYPADLERIKEAQGLLNELGPVLIELKLLEP